MAHSLLSDTKLLFGAATVSNLLISAKEAKAHQATNIRQKQLQNVLPSILDASARQKHVPAFPKKLLAAKPILL
jgi:hypothetical protein